MKNLMIYINPRKDFDDEGKVAVKIQIDNSLDLGWKRKDIMLVTNFSYEYNGVKAQVVPDDNFCTFWPEISKILTIIYLIDKGSVRKGELYWFHDLDVFQLEIILEPELELEGFNMGLTDKGLRPRLDTGSIFFKSSAKDIFVWTKELVYKYQKERANDEFALMVLTTNNLLWVTIPESGIGNNVVPANIPGAENVNKRVKKLNISYNFWDGTLGETYKMAIIPIKAVHFHFTNDLLLDSFMYGKNSLKKVVLPLRLINIFKMHGVSGVRSKKMKNLMIYINPEKKFAGEAESLLRNQVENSLKLGWKKEDIVLLTNFPYEYFRIKATVIDEKISKADVVFYLLEQGVVKEGELWWYHDLDVFQLQQKDRSEIDLEGTTAGFINTGNFFFRKDSNKLFEWMRNRARKFNGDEEAALDSLASGNYRNINALYKKLNIDKMFERK